MLALHADYLILTVFRRKKNKGQQMSDLSRPKPPLVACVFYLVSVYTCF